ncbi:hypothetical protein OG749_34570 [Streptomyces nojiriensis]|uniref:hypothetical protein n=1 Tax=Streptomyces nojiriensis TaxID=66374 RepID=UPI002E18123D
MVQSLLLEDGFAGGEDPDVFELISSLWEAFDITLGQALLVSEWVGLKADGVVSEERVELEIGRLVPRFKELDIGVLDRGRQALRQPRSATLVGDHQSFPLRFQGDFFVHHFSAHLGLLVLRSWVGDTAGEAGVLDIEFQHVQGMRVAADYRGLLMADASDVPDAAGVDVVDEMEAFVPPQSTQQFKRVLLSDGTRRGFVVCHSVRVYRFDSFAGWARWVEAKTTAERAPGCDAGEASRSGSQITGGWNSRR